MVENKGLIPL